MEASAASDKSARRAHLVGIHGSGMAALAQVLADWGWELTGSDTIDGPRPPAVSRLARVAIGHRPENVGGAELVIHSEAVPADNCELAYARQRRIPLYTYFQMVGRLAAARRLLAVAGTHGKSTTTAMAAAILDAARRDATVFCGAVPRQGSSGGRGGKNGLVLAEACEYRSHFLELRPAVAVLHQIELDHVDCFPEIQAVEQAFMKFAGRLGQSGRLIVRHECPRAREVARKAGCRVETFGWSPDADWHVGNLVLTPTGSRFEIVFRGRNLAEVCLSVLGRHNALNAVAAAALCAEEAGCIGVIAESLGRFAGLRRRLERLPGWRGVECWDDYAHHPTEVRAALDALREKYPDRKIWCVFQPHQASRTARLLDELAASLDNTGLPLVAEIFRAREPPFQPGDISAADLARAVRTRGRDVPAIHDLPGIARWLRRHMAAGDVLLTMGAGDVGRLHALLGEE